MLILVPWLWSCSGGPVPVAGVEAALERATKKLEDEEKRSSVPQGAELPPDWPRFEIGERVGPVRPSHGR